MKIRSRFYDSMLLEHVQEYRQMAFVAGPRQVGKTTTCRRHSSVYLDWDNDNHRDLILRGPSAVAEFSGLNTLLSENPVIVFDELHKYRRWKQFLKGFFDTYESKARIIVTGSSRLDTFKRGGDSLMGRYFSFHMHPLSVAELLAPDINLGESIIRPPMAISDNDWQVLINYGGFPEPFMKKNEAFSRRWQSLRRTTLFKEDVRDLTRVQELSQLQALGDMLAARSGQQLVYSNLAKNIRVSENTARSWIETLSSLHYGFLVRPWYKNVAKSLRKEPKWYLRDWSNISDPGQRVETMCAVHLLKAVDGWRDLGLGEFGLWYIRDKQKREVDFLVTREGAPWFMVEVKASDEGLSPSLDYFKKQTDCPHAFQVVFTKDYVNEDCFKSYSPIIVPARTFLSQLL